MCSIPHFVCTVKCQRLASKQALLVMNVCPEKPTAWRHARDSCMADQQKQTRSYSVDLSPAYFHAGFFVVSGLHFLTQQASHYVVMQATGTLVRHHALLRAIQTQRIQPYSCCC